MRILSISVFVFIIGLSFSQAETVWGEYKTNMTLLTEKIFRAVGPGWRKSRDTFVYFIPCENEATIAYISALNRFENSAKANLVQGGPGQKYVQIDVESGSFLSGYDFLIKVYGERPEGEMDVDDWKHNLTAISHIEALNTLDSSATADLLAGGPLHTFVYIHIENAIDKPYNFTISVYGW